MVGFTFSSAEPHVRERFCIVLEDIEGGEYDGEIEVFS